ncbi:MAG: DNRLRE domain-containing protein [Candidatus Eisenbacteria sp.]|nr:DNRLRE domain-containing protein [Candidatus Eisenbacteria bacterium]
MRAYWVLAAAMLVGLLAPVASADTLTIEPTDDMYTDPYDPYPHPQGELWVANHAGCQMFQRIMMKFDLSEIANATIVSATLNMFRFHGCPNHPYTSTDFYAITQDWCENTWPQNQHIPHGSQIWASFRFGPGTYCWYAVDIRDLVQAWVDGTIDDYGLAVEARYYEGRCSRFYSKDYGVSSRHPYLVVEYISAGAIAGDKAQHMAIELRCSNPISQPTTIDYSLENEGLVSIDILNILGQRVETLVSGYRPAGQHCVTWGGAVRGDPDVTAGIYFLRMRVGDAVIARKVHVIR